MTIASAIVTQRFELIRDRIGEILANELASQAALKPDPILLPTNLKVWVERFIDFDKEELPAINVSLSSGDYKGETVVTANGNYIFTIDIMTKGKSKNNGGSVNHGDKTSAFECQMISGVCRSILSNSIYKTLGFAPGFIAGRKVNSIAVAQMDNQEGIYPYMIRIDLLVAATEKTVEELPKDAAGYDTIFTINETDKGFIFTLNND